MVTQPSVKKKIMFSKGDDFYFLSYNILLILYGMDCFCGQRTFKDYRKLSFLIDFVSNRNLAQTASSNMILLNPVDRELFTRAYANGMLRLNQVIRLLFTLEKRGFVTLERELGADTVNVCLNKEAIDKSFFNKDLFKPELNNLKLIKASVQRTTVLTLENLLTRLFDNHGIRRWAN
jgi:hypothetical protein